MTTAHKPRPAESPWHPALVAAVGTDQTREALTMVHVADGRAYGTDSYRLVSQPTTMADGLYTVTGEPASERQSRDLQPLAASMAGLVAKAAGEPEQVTVTRLNRAPFGAERFDMILAGLEWFTGTRRRPGAAVRIEAAGPTPLDGPVKVTPLLQVEMAAKGHRTRTFTGPTMTTDLASTGPMRVTLNASYLADMMTRGWYMLQVAGPAKPVLVRFTDGETVGLVMPIREPGTAE